MSAIPIVVIISDIDWGVGRGEKAEREGYWLLWHTISFWQRQDHLRILLKLGN